MSWPNLQWQNDSQGNLWKMWICNLSCLSDQEYEQWVPSLCIYLVRLKKALYWGQASCWADWLWNCRHEMHRQRFDCTVLFKTLYYYYGMYYIQCSLDLLILLPATYFIFVHSTCHCQRLGSYDGRRCVLRFQHTFQLPQQKCIWSDVMAAVATKSGTSPRQVMQNI